jgi:DNA-binding SARP family transcriptional activator
LLGPLRVVDTDGNSFISAPKVEVLLAALLIRVNHVVTADQLIAELWGENLPRRATAGLHVYVSELRKFLSRLGQPGTPIITRAPGYMLHQGGDRLDSQTFLERTAQGRSCMQAGRHQDASEHFEGALALWRGPVLGGIGSGPILQGFATRLTEARMECTEMLVECRLQLGRHRQMVGLLYTMIIEYPLREAFYRQLMLALHRSERRADALRVYQSARRVLREELGLEPCASLRELHQAILVADDVELLKLSAAVC